MNSLLSNRALKIALSFSLVQQLLVAFSTYCIAMLAKTVATGQDYMLWLAGFVLSLVVVYAPAYWAQVFLERAKFDALFAYVRHFDAHFYGKATLLNSQPLKHTATALVAQESKPTLDEALDFLFDFAALVLNIGLNLLVLVLVIDGNLLWAYGLGMALSFIVVRLGKEHLSSRAKNAQDSRIHLLAKLSQLWDNSIIGNRYNHQHYSDTLNHSKQAAKRCGVASVAAGAIFANVGMLALMLPVLGLLGFLFVHDTSTASLALLVATLPRQIQMLQMSYSLIGHLTQITLIKTRLQGMLAILSPLPDNALDPYIRQDAISIAQTGASISTLSNQPLPNTGRMTLTGANGSGKSCFLLQLKQRLGDSAFYLPAQHVLNFAGDFGALSTGQRLFAQLNELASTLPKQTPPVSVLLLDEWDANLDSNNKHKLDALLDTLSQQLLVLEVRHR